VGETLWFAQSDMATLFQCSVDNIALHLRNIYEDGELDPLATAEDFSVVLREIVREEMTFCERSRSKTPSGDRVTGAASGATTLLFRCYFQILTRPHLDRLGANGVGVY